MRKPTFGSALHCQPQLTAATSHPVNLIFSLRALAAQILPRAHIFAHGNAA